jgi:hypothetical protein
MDAKQFLDTYGAQAARDVCDKAGTKLQYFKYMAQRKSYPSRPLAWKLIWASGGRLTLEGLLPPPEETERAQYQF